MLKAQKRSFAWLIAATLALILSACSSEPSEAEMAIAVKRKTESLMGPMGGSTDSFELRKLGCTAVERGYLCEFSAHLNTPFGPQDGKDSGIFTKGENGWEVTEK